MMVGADTTDARAAESVQIRNRTGVRWDRWIANLAIRGGILRAVEWLERRQPNILRVLDYHRIADPWAGEVCLDPSLISATPDEFDQQMQLLVRNYNVLSLDDLLQAYAAGGSLPPRAVMVTFDDGYLDFKTVAWPILRKYQIPAVLFVATDYMSDRRSSYWWDRLYHAMVQTQERQVTHPTLGTWDLGSHGSRQGAFEGIKQLLCHRRHHTAMVELSELLDSLGVPPPQENGLLTWGELRDLLRQGLYVAAHTRSHAFLSRLTLEEARNEIKGSQQAILQKLGKTWPVFAFPSGHPQDFTPEVIDLLRDEGFKLGMTMIEGHNHFGRTSPLLLRRVGMTANLSMQEFRLALSRIYTYYGWLLRVRALIQR